MMKGRIVAHRRLCCPVKDAGFTLRHNTAVAGSPWWVHCNHGGKPIPSDESHQELVSAVNELKRLEGQGEGGKFSLNEHGQLIARMKAAPGQGNSIQVIGVVGGKVYAYHKRITFDRGKLDPKASPSEGDPWTGPKCGISYSFHPPHTRKPPSRREDEIEFRLEAETVHLSVNAVIPNYPPSVGDLAEFLKALRRRFPKGGRFRVNEHRRAFTSDDTRFIGIVPLAEWFKPLHVRS